MSKRPLIRRTKEKSPSKSKLALKNELQDLLNDCKDSPYWKRKPKLRQYIVENEKEEEYYDNLVLESLKEYDNICGQKFENGKICFQKHCSHKKETQEREPSIEKNSINLLIEAINFLEEKEKKHEILESNREIIKLVDYSDSSEDEIESTEEELITGQAPLYLPSAKFFAKSYK